MNRRLTLLALLAAGAASLPATAHARPVYAGFTCGFASVRASGFTGRRTYVGTVFDYFYAGDTGSGPAASVFIKCSVRVNGVEVAAAASNTAGPAGLLAPTQVVFDAGTGDFLEACTVVQAFDGSGQVIYELDGPNGRCNEVTRGDADDPTTEDPEDGAGAGAEPWDREAGA